MEKIFVTLHSEDFEETSFLVTWWRLHDILLVLEDVSFVENTNAIWDIHQGLIQKGLKSSSDSVREATKGLSRIKKSIVDTYKTDLLCWMSTAELCSHVTRPPSEYYQGKKDI